MKKPSDINPMTWMWCNIEANSFLKHSLSDFIKVTWIAIVMVLGSIQDERTFNMLTFMKNKLHNQLTTDLAMVVGMESQSFFTLNDFSYDATYESWRDEAKRQCNTH